MAYELGDHLIEEPPVRGETYFCFTPDQLQKEVDRWEPFPLNDGRNVLMRKTVLAFMYSQSVSKSKIRKEAPGMA